MAKDASVLNTLMRRVIRDDLKMKSRAKEQCQTLTEPNKAKRVTCCKSILNWMKSNSRKAIIFFWWQKLECWQASQSSKHPILGQKQVSCWSKCKLCCQKQISSQGHVFWNRRDRWVCFQANLDLGHPEQQKVHWNFGWGGFPCIEWALWSWKLYPTAGWGPLT